MGAALFSVGQALWQPELEQEQEYKEQEQKPEQEREQYQDQQDQQDHQQQEQQYRRCKRCCRPRPTTATQRAAGMSTTSPSTISRILVAASHCGPAHRTKRPQSRAASSSARPALWQGERQEQRHKRQEE
jgi:hypothetical protein